MISNAGENARASPAEGNEIAVTIDDKQPCFTERVGGWTLGRVFNIFVEHVEYKSNIFN